MTSSFSWQNSISLCPASFRIPGLKLNIQKMKIMASGPITSWEIFGETVETVSDFIFLGSKITADGDCSHKIKRRLLLGRKVMTNLDSIFKSRGKKAERRRIDAFEVWYWRRLLRIPWTARRSNQSILKEISSGCSLERLMLKLKLQYFGHLMWRVFSDSCPLSPWCHPTIPSSVTPFSSCPQSFPASGSFPMSQPFASGGQIIGDSALASFLPMNTQNWSPLEWTAWISLQSKGLSRVFSNTTVQKHQFFGAQLSSQSNSYIHTWPLEKI